VQILGSGNLPSEDAFRQSFDSVLWLRPTIKIEAVSGSTETIDIASTSN
jgi:hypothetical protein